MWKKSIQRGLVSYCISVTVTLIIYTILSLCGVQNLCIPAFIRRAGGEINACLLQPLLIGLIGLAFGASSVMFEIESWSLLRQGATHLAVTAAAWIVVHLICFTPFTPPAVVSFVASLFASYTITWGAQYFVLRAKVRRINEQIRQKNEES